MEEFKMILYYGLTAIALIAMGALAVFSFGANHNAKRMRQREQADAEAEMIRCEKSPWYFMTNYYIVDGKPFKTNMNQQQFDERFAALSGYDYEPMYPMNDESLQGSAAKEL